LMALGLPFYWYWSRRNAPVLGTVTIVEETDG
jgi:hypothetical protein